MQKEYDIRHINISSQGIFFYTLAGFHTELGIIVF